MHTPARLNLSFSCLYNDLLLFVFESIAETFVYSCGCDDALPPEICLCVNFVLNGFGVGVIEDRCYIANG